MGRVRRLRRVSFSSELLMCGGDVRSILLLPLLARCHHHHHHHHHHVVSVCAVCEFSV